MSNKRKSLAGGLERRSTSGSVYDEKGLDLGDEFNDFTDSISAIDEKREIIAEKERVEKELAEVNEKAIIPQEDSSLKFRQLKMQPTGLEAGSIPDTLTEDDIIDMVRALRQVDEAVQWTIGDLMNYAVTKWNDERKYEQYALATGYAEKTLREYAYVARSLPSSIRMDRLSFGHHQLVAGFKDKDGNPIIKDQIYWLEKATAGDDILDKDGTQKIWSVARLRQEILNDKRAKNTKLRRDEHGKKYAKKMRDLVTLLDTDLSTLKDKNRQAHLKSVADLRTLLTRIEEKLQQSAET